MTRTQIASLGGKALFQKYGSNHMRQIGKSGQAKFRKLYQWKPAGTSGWALVRRDNNQVVAFVGSRPGGR